MDPRMAWRRRAIHGSKDGLAMEGHPWIHDVTETLMGRGGDTLQGCAHNPGPPSGAPVKRATTSQRRTKKSAARKPGERPRRATNPSQRA